MGVESLGSLSEKYGVPEIKIQDYEIESGILSLVPSYFAHKLRVIPLNVDRRFLIVAMEDPTDRPAIDLIKAITEYGVEVTVASPESIQEALDDYYAEQLLH